MRPLFLALMLAIPACADAPSGAEADVPVEVAPAADTGDAFRIPRPMEFGGADGGGGVLTEDPSGTCSVVPRYPCTRWTGRGGTDCDPETEQCVCRRNEDCSYSGHTCIPRRR